MPKKEGATCKPCERCCRGGTPKAIGDNNGAEKAISSVIKHPLAFLPVNQLTLFLLDDGLEGQTTQSHHHCLFIDCVIRGLLNAATSYFVLEWLALCVNTRSPLGTYCISSVESHE